MSARISVSTNIFCRFGLLHHPLHNVLRFAHDAGFDGVELTENITTRLVGAERIRATAEKVGIPILSVHQSLMRMLWSSFSSIDHILRRAKTMHAEFAVVHVAATHRAYSNHEYFNQVHQLEKKHGIPVAFENAMAQFHAFKPSSFAHAHEPEHFAEGTAENNLILTYDVGHMAARTTDLAGYMEKIHSRVKNIHLHDYWRGVDHLALGTGTLPLKEFLRYLKTTGYDGVITLEVFPLNLHPLLSIREVEEIVRRSLHFVREALA